MQLLAIVIGVVIAATVLISIQLTVLVLYHLYGRYKQRSASDLRSTLRPETAAVRQGVRARYLTNQYTQNPRGVFLQDYYRSNNTNLFLDHSRVPTNNNNMINNMAACDNAWLFGYDCAQVYHTLDPSLPPWHPENQENMATDLPAPVQLTPMSQMYANVESTNFTTAMPTIDQCTSSQSFALPGAAVE